MREHALSLAGTQLVQLAMDVHQLPVAKLKALMEPAFEQAGLRKQQAGAVKSILVLLFDAVGDTVLTTGFMRQLCRNRYWPFSAIRWTRMIFCQGYSVVFIALRRGRSLISPCARIRQLGVAKRKSSMAAAVARPRIALRLSRPKKS